MGGQKFTRVSDDGRKFSKLGRFLVSPTFNLVWRNLGVKALERRWSDHFPIMLGDSNRDFGPKPFNLFDTWLAGEDMENLVRMEWDKEVITKRPDCVFKDKLKKVKNVLKNRCSVMFKSLEDELEKNKEEVVKIERDAGSRPIDENESKRLVEARKKWLEAEKKKFEMATQRAKIKWIEEGGENSKFFHAAIRSRERKNGIRG